MEKVTFQDPQTAEEVEFYVLEETRLNGVNYLLVTVEEDGDSDAFILKDVSGTQDEEAIYEMVEEDEELEYISRIFSEILDDVDITM